MLVLNDTIFPLRGGNGGAKALLLWNPQLFRIASENVRQHGLLHRAIFVCTVRPDTVCALVKILRLEIGKEGI